MLEQDTKSSDSLCNIYLNVSYINNSNFQQERNNKLQTISLLPIFYSMGSKYETIDLVCHLDTLQLGVIFDQTNFVKLQEHLSLSTEYLQNYFSSTIPVFTPELHNQILMTIMMQHIPVPKDWQNYLYLLDKQPADQQI